jgi:hypothetical protein
LAWHCDGRNLASRRTAEKAGMQLEGVLRAHRLVDGVRRDTYCFAMLKELRVTSLRKRANFNAETQRRKGAEIPEGLF